MLDNALNQKTTPIVHAKLMKLKREVADNILKLLVRRACVRNQNVRSANSVFEVVNFGIIFNGKNVTSADC